MNENENPQSRNEALLQNILGDDNETGAPQSRIEAILQNILGANNALEEPQSRNEKLLMKILEEGAGGGGGGGSEDDFAIEDCYALFTSGHRLGVLENLAKYCKPTTAQEMFFQASNMSSVPLFDMSNCINAINMFAHCAGLTSLPLFNLHSCTQATQMFWNCTNLTSIPSFDTRSIYTASGMFSNCNKVTDMPVFNFADMGQNHFESIFKNCNSLTNESLNNILQSLSTIRHPATLKYAGLSQEQAEICTTLSNWQTLSDAGWTTGY